MAYDTQEGWPCQAQFVWLRAGRKAFTNTPKAGTIYLLYPQAVHLADATTLPRDVPAPKPGNLWGCNLQGYVLQSRVAAGRVGYGRILHVIPISSPLEISVPLAVNATMTLSLYSLEVGDSRTISCNGWVVSLISIIRRFVLR